MRFVTLFVAVGWVGIFGCASMVAATAADTDRPSIAAIRTVDFLGKKFERKFEATDKPVRIYEYFPQQQTPDNWLELIEFQVYPVNPDGNEPLDHARRTATAFKQKYPAMQFALYSDKNTGAVLLDFFYPTSTRKEPGKEFLEFNAFKFFRDTGSPLTMSFHYAKNIEGISSSRTIDDVTNDIKKTRQEVVPAMARFPLYRQ